MILCILGRQPELGLTELESLYPGKVTRFGSEAALVNIDRLDIQNLGGSQKAARVVYNLYNAKISEISHKIIDSYSKRAIRKDLPKLTIGISAYNTNIKTTQIKKIGAAIKFNAKKLGGTVRIIPNNDPILNTATSHHNKLGLRENKKEIINSSHAKAKEELLDYLYNYFEITPDTVLISNSDNGKGYTCRILIELKKALNIQHHEHFWDTYHLNEKIKSFFKPYPKDLQDVCFKAIQTHDRELLKTVFDTCEGIITDEEGMNQLLSFKQKMFRNFRYTKPASLRGLSDVNIGIMESQHRKVTYRMKHQGMYWSEMGANTLSQMILLERNEELEELFFGQWRQEREQYKSVVMSAGKLKTRSWQNPFTKTHGIAGHLLQRCEYKKASKNPYF